MSERSFDDVLLAQVFIDGLRLRRRLHDYQSLWHRILSRRGRESAAWSLWIAISQRTLPHFNKVLAGKLFDEPHHLQLEKRCDQLGTGDIRQLFKEIVEMYGGIHLEGFKDFPRRAIERWTGLI